MYLPEGKYYQALTGLGESVLNLLLIIFIGSKI